MNEAALWAEEGTQDDDWRQSLGESGGKKRNKHLRVSTVRVPAHHALECYEIANSSPVVRYPPQRRMLPFGAEGVSAMPARQGHVSR